MVIQTAKALVQRVKNVADNLQAPEPVQVQPLPAVDPNPKDWTVLVYMEGKNRLAHSTDLALNKLEKVGTSDHVNLVVQATQEPTWQELTLPNMHSLPTRRYVIQKDSDDTKVTSPVVQEFEGQLPLNQDSLADFVKWGMEKFPARHTMLVIKKHGAGFAKISNCKEDFAPLSARELSNALKTLPKPVDVIAFDSCSMQQVEVAYQLRGQAKVMTGAPEDIKAVAYPYDKLAEGLNTISATATAQDVGKLVVDVHKGQAAIHDAADLSKLDKLKDKMKSFVEKIKSAKVPVELLYTRMASVTPMERRSLGLTFDFRDLGTFLSNLKDESRLPEGIRAAAGEVRESLQDAVLSHYSSPVRQELKTPTGMAAYMPWKAPSDKLHETYNELDWAKDSGWGELLDYVHTQQAEAAHPQPTAQDKAKALSLSQSFGKWGLYQYKKYISPFLDAKCQYTPSCSQYAREAIETLGLWEGGKLGFLRMVSCTGHYSGPDPVPGGHVCSPGCGCNKPHIKEELLVSPPRRLDKSETRQRLEGFVTQAAATAGYLAGGTALALLAAPVGAALGGYFGAKAGANTIDELTAGMLEKYGEAKTAGYLNIARPVGMPAYKLNQKIAEWTGSETLANVVGGVAGGLSGALMGMAGGAAQGFTWGSAFGRLWGQNRARDAFGDLPVNPANDAILRQDYEGPK